MTEAGRPAVACANGEEERLNLGSTRGLVPLGCPWSFVSPAGSFSCWRQLTRSAPLVSPGAQAIADVRRSNGAVGFLPADRAYGLPAVARLAWGCCRRIRHCERSEAIQRGSSPDCSSYAPRKGLRPSFPAALQHVGHGLRVVQPLDRAFRRGHGRASSSCALPASVASYTVIPPARK